MEGMKRVNVNVPRELWDRFREILPYRGEPTAFFNRCIEAAVSSQVPADVVRKIDKIIERARQDAEEKR